MFYEIPDNGFIMNFPEKIPFFKEVMDTSSSLAEKE